MLTEMVNALSLKYNGQPSSSCYTLTDMFAKFEGSDFMKYFFGMFQGG